MHKAVPGHQEKLIFKLPTFNHEKKKTSVRSPEKKQQKENLDRFEVEIGLTEMLSFNAWLQIESFKKTGQRKTPLSSAPIGVAKGYGKQNLQLIFGDKTRQREGETLVLTL